MIITAILVLLIAFLLPLNILELDDDFYYEEEESQEDDQDPKFEDYGV